MDRVPAMRDFYARGGFRAAGRSARFEGVGAAAPVPAGLVDARELRLADLVAYDAVRFPAPRQAFLEPWLAQPGARALAAVAGGRIVGYGVIRPCRRGFKVGPLFAADARVASDLLTGLGDRAAGEPLFLDAPEANPAAAALARGRGMREVFACVRMYHGPAPRLPCPEIFGVTTFELG